jgi:hypothetical protein
MFKHVTGTAQVLRAFDGSDSAAGACSQEQQPILAIGEPGPDPITGYSAILRLSSVSINWIARKTPYFMSQKRTLCHENCVAKTESIIVIARNIA